MEILCSLQLYCSCTMLPDHAASVCAMDGTQLLEQIDKNLNPESYESYRKLINIEPDGRKKEYHLLYRQEGEGQDCRSLSCRRPAKRAGAPSGWATTCGSISPTWESRSASRASSPSSAVSSTTPTSWPSITRRSTTSKRSRNRANEYLLYLKAKTKTVAYDRLKMWVDKEKKLPTKIECLTEANMLIKTLYFKDVKDFGAGS